MRIKGFEIMTLSPHNPKVVSLSLFTVTNEIPLFKLVTEDFLCVA
jgi:hypothetical protein